MVIQLALLTAVHVEIGEAAATATVPVEATAEMVAEEGVRAKGGPAAAWVTENVMPPTAMLAVRADAPLFASTE